MLSNCKCGRYQCQISLDPCLSLSLSLTFSPMLVSQFTRFLQHISPLYPAKPIRDFGGLISNQLPPKLVHRPLIQNHLSNQCRWLGSGTPVLGAISTWKSHLEVKGSLHIPHPINRKSLCVPGLWSSCLGPRTANI